MPPPIKSNRLGRISDSDESDTPSNNLWVGNLASDVTDSDLMDLFAQYGALDSVTTYSPRSYAFVFFKLVEDAKAAKDALQGAELRGNRVKIEFARPTSIGSESQYKEAPTNIHDGHRIEGTQPSTNKL